MNPLEPLIGLFPVDSGSERMFVNRLPNVSAALIEAIAEDEEKSVGDTTGIETVWQEIKDEQFDCLKSDLLSEFAKRANFRQVVEVSEIPSISGDETLIVDGDTLIGVVVTMPKSRYQSLFIRNLFVDFNSDTAPENVVIKIYDADKATQIGTDISIPFVIGTDDYPINISVDCSKMGNKAIFIGIIIPDGATLYSLGWHNHCKYSVVDLYRFDPDHTPFMSEMTELSDCYVGLEFEIRLSIDKVVAQFSDILKRSYGLMCAIGIIDRALKSKKANRFTQVNRDMEKQNIFDLKEDLKKEMAGACRQIYAQLNLEQLALVSNPEDQQNYFLGSYV